MKVGMIFECGPDGPDRKVCEHLAKRIITDLKISSKTLTDKKNLLAECGIAAALLLSEGCELVFIVWDLYPAWRQKGERPCRHADKETICLSLNEAGVDLTRIKLICITEELEAWLLADGRALTKFLSTQIRTYPINDEKRPERVTNPKKQLTKIFEQNGGREYTDFIHAIKIAEAIPDLKRIRRSKTFFYFAQKLIGNDDIRI